VFLSALAPELCAASGSSLNRFTALAETMGLPRVVRSLEILGLALVDMREAPDAQVVLEIAVVRAVRPDLDSGMEALSERVSLLERSISGGAAFPRPGAATERPAAPPPVSGGPAPAPSPASAAPPADVGRRPSIGAVRRSQQAASSTATTEGPAPAPAPAPAAAPAAAGTIPAAPAAAAPPPASAGAVDRDGLTEAWGDGILQSLPARAKARYASGRFVAVDEQGAHFALPNAAHRDQCVEHLPTVEAALAAHFGSPVTLVLDVDDAGAAGRPAAPGAPAPGSGTGDDDLDHVDPADLMEDAPAADTDQASAAEARLLEAFPGASEVAG